MGKRFFRFALLALIGMTAVLGIATPIIRHFFDVEAAENFLANGATGFGMLVLLTILALAAYGTDRLAGWLIWKVARRD
jgi:hypothetical protein